MQRHGSPEKGPGLESVEVRFRTEDSRANGQYEPGNRALVGGWKSAGNRDDLEKENILSHKRIVSAPNVSWAGE